MSEIDRGSSQVFRTTFVSVEHGEIAIETNVDVNLELRSGYRRTYATRVIGGQYNGETSTFTADSTRESAITAALAQHVELVGKVVKAYI